MPDGHCHALKRNFSTQSSSQCMADLRFLFPADSATPLSYWFVHPKMLCLS